MDKIVLVWCAQSGKNLAALKLGVISLIERNAEDLQLPLSQYNPNIPW